MAEVIMMQNFPKAMRYGQKRNKDTWAKVLSHLSKQTLLVNAKKRLQFTFRQRLVIIGHE